MSTFYKTEKILGLVLVAILAAVIIIMIGLFLVTSLALALAATSTTSELQLVDNLSRLLILIIENTTLKAFLTLF